MTLLILGVALWWAGHLFKRAAPGLRAGMGDRGRGVVALVLLVSVVLMVLGYRGAGGAVYWGRSPALVGVNNLVMLASVYLFAAAGMKTAVARRLRHPMLLGVLLWSAAHLLVNGDAASVVLFGGIGLWALVEMAVIGRADPWVPPRGKGPKMEIFAILGTVLVYGVLAGAHYLLGYPAFG
ncbi:NnrU family protein [Ruixingdingia sedimenti]|uniref:NnrU family protein n=1 Tax=Ruixingdingia sedimenti TaxID=3073604 RepID=A0ABU1F4F8_9RHOB|nr:NnrU family protein [Xinfangfangia sp. LG-4]MDR5651742.1 NnrU family protein [Xinfangfangia sp. LG-4]